MESKQECALAVLQETGARYVEGERMNQFVEKLETRLKYGISRAEGMAP